MLRIDAPFLPVAIALMVGIVVGERTEGWMAVAAALAAVLTATLFLRRHPRWQTTAILVCTLLFGILLRIHHDNRASVQWPEAPVAWNAVVVDEPIEKANTMTVDVLLTDFQRKVRCHIVKSNDSQAITVGDGLLLTVRIRDIQNFPSKFGSTHTFDYRRFMASRGFSGTAYVRLGDWNWKTIGLSNLSRTERMRLRFMVYRHALLSHIRQWHLDPATEGVVKAMTLGDRSVLVPEVRATYIQTGVSHILALSGMHLAIIYFIIHLLMSWRRAELLSQAVIVATLWAYALLVGLSPSVTRSAFMISVYALLSVGYRDSASINTLSLTAIVMLLVNPLSIYDVSFQLSYAAVFSILLGNALLRNVDLAPWLQSHRAAKWFWGITVISLEAQIGTAPLAAYHFGVFNPCALLANYFVIPLATLTIYLTLLALATSWWTGLSLMGVAVLSFVVHAMNGLLQQVSTIPYSHLDFQPLGAWQTLFIYLLLGILIFLTIKFLKLRVVIK